MSDQISDGLSPVSITVAPNGGRRGKADHAALPLTETELVQTASECLAAGAAMIHLHIRDSEGRHSLDAGTYQGVMHAIKAVTGDRLIIQITTEALGLYTPAQQIDVTKAVRPEAVSLALRELAPDAASESAFADFLLFLKRESVMPQIILYAPEEARRFASMRERGMIPWNDAPVLYVLGRYVKDQLSKPEDLLAFLGRDVPRFSHWTTCAFGRHEAAAVTAGTLLGGHVRVGFENNLYLPDGSLARSNADLVSTVADILERCGVTLLDADGLRKSWTQFD